MNTYEFFVEHFGKHLIEVDDLSPSAAAYKALSSNHKLQKGTTGRLSSGWAIVRPNRSTVQLKLAASRLNFDDRTRLEAFGDELKEWDGTEPRLFLMFDKAPLPISNLFLSVDRRLVRICSPAGVESFDADAEPTPDSGGIQKALWKRRLADA
jgi:hypothetical protein